MRDDRTGIRRAINPRRIGWVSAILIAVALITPVGAHFLLNLNVRILHVDHARDGLVLHMRTPMPYLVADKLGTVEGDALPEPAPFTSNARQDGQIVHYVDRDALAADPFGLGRIADDSLIIETDGARLRGTVEAVAVHAVGTEPAFATLDEARRAFPSSPALTTLPDGLFVGDTIVDVTIRYATQGAVETYSLSSSLDPGLPGQEMTANLILDYGPGEPKVYRTRGLMTDPIEVSRSRWAAVETFVWEGVRHILEGLDHVLFVICLILGAHSLGSLLSRVTGFTIGHSVTLALGFFGYVPKGDWFVPAVETGIALSIIYAAAVALRAQRAGQGQEKQIFAITLLIGLLHGLGFSFVLQEILQVTAPNIWQSLLAFNVGVELGQVLIVIAIWPLLKILNRSAEPAERWLRSALAIGCIGIALYWTVERTAQIAASVG